MELLIQVLMKRVNQCFLKYRYYLIAFVAVLAGVFTWVSWQPQLTHNSITVLQAKDFNIRDYTGEVLYLDFWASWCAPCLDSFPWMIAQHNKNYEKGLRIVAVTVDADFNDAAQFLHQFAVPFTIVYDPTMQLFNAYSITGLPTSILFDRDGRLSQRILSFYPEQIPIYTQHIDTVL